MTLFRQLFVIALLAILARETSAQNKNRSYPQNYFSLPLNLAPSISGTFGELRNNHLHSGLDYRTNQRSGYPVYAVADGYISRLKVQVGGFGNTVYIDHPNGYTSVYAHLLNFNERIASTVKACQYEDQSFAVDFPVPALTIPVKKNELIAWSGNTGRSAGPHLHFEIRDTQTEEVINPKLFGLTITDRKKPQIDGLYIYQLDGKPFSEHTTKRFLSVKKIMETYALNQPSPIVVSDEVGFGIIAFDRAHALDGKHGVYVISLSMDGQTIYSSRFDRFSFNQSRAINSYVDYPTLLTSGQWVQKSFVEPGNPLPIYDQLVNNGLVRLNDQKIHHMKYTLQDIAGNTSTLSFSIRYKSQHTKKPINVNKAGTLVFKYNQPNTFASDDVRVTIPANTLYSDINFSYSYSPSTTHTLSAIHHIHNKLTPLNDTISLWIRPSKTPNINLKEKMIVVNKEGIYQGGAYENGYVKTTVKTLGSFYITVDTVPPKIVPLNLHNDKMHHTSQLLFKISDDLSGIKSFVGSLNGKWVLMDFDSKKGLLSHTFDPQTDSESQLFTLVVTDYKANKRIYQTTLVR